VIRCDLHGLLFFIDSWYQMLSGMGTVTVQQWNWQTTGYWKSSWYTNCSKCWYRALITVLSRTLGCTEHQDRALACTTKGQFLSLEVRFRNFVCFIVFSLIYPWKMWYCVSVFVLCIYLFVYLFIYGLHENAFRSLVWSQMIGSLGNNELQRM
jgi:hypothetical protein